MTLAGKNNCVVCGVPLEGKTRIFSGKDESTRGPFCSWLCESNDWRMLDMLNKLTPKMVVEATVDAINQAFDRQGYPQYKSVYKNIDFKSAITKYVAEQVVAKAALDVATAATRGGTTD